MHCWTSMDVPLYLSVNSNIIFQVAKERLEIENMEVRAQLQDKVIEIQHFQQLTERQQQQLEDLEDQLQQQGDQLQQQRDQLQQQRDQVQHLEDELHHKEEELQQKEGELRLKDEELQKYLHSHQVISGQSLK